MCKLKSVFAHLLPGTICSQAENTLNSSSHRLQGLDGRKARATLQVCLTLCVPKQGILARETRNHLRSYHQ